MITDNISNVIIPLGVLIIHGEHKSEGVSPGTEISLEPGHAVSLGGVDNFDAVDTTRIGFSQGFDGIHIY